MTTTIYNVINDIGILFDRLVHDRGSGGACLQEIGGDQIGGGGQTLGGPLLRPREHVLAASNGVRKLGIERHGLLHFDDIDEGEVGGLPLRQLTDELDRPVVFGTA